MDNPHVVSADRRIANAKAILAKAETESRDLTADELRSYDELLAGAKSEAQRAETYVDIRSALEKYRRSGPPSDPTTRRTDTALETRSADRKTEKAILVPSMAEYRALAEGTDSTGGYTTPVEHANTIVDRLRPSSVFLQAAPRLFTMTSDKLHVPKIGTSSSVAMVAENTPIPESDISFAAALFTARKLAGLVRASNEWLFDSVPDGRLIVEQDLLRQMALLLDEQFFNGDGIAPNMLGILGWTGVNGTPGAATIDDIAEAIARVESANATPSAIFISPHAWGIIRRERDAGATGAYVLQPDASAAARPRLFGVEVFPTPEVGSTIVVADMRYIGVGVRDRMNVHFDPYRYSEYDQTAIRVTSRWDIQPLHDEAIEIITGVEVGEGESES